MYEYLNDNTFLKALDEYKTRVQYAKIIVMDFDENPIKDISGNIVSGSVNVDGSSSVRRTISLTIAFPKDGNDIENVDNIISINKKIKVEVGYENPLSDYRSLYGEIIWFPCGLYLVSSASISYNAQGRTLSVSGKDKMVLLNGSVGGTLPASVTFNETYIYDNDGNVTIEYPTIYQIIRETVSHYGGEPENNIIINDVDSVAKLLIKYMGSQTIYFDTEYKSFSTEKDSSHTLAYSKGQDVGYRKTDATYPGELVMKAGDTVTSVLDKIVEQLGNYEYFYDIYGRFIFQQKRNYLNNRCDLESLIEEGTISNYTSVYSNTKYEYDLSQTGSIISIQSSPKYDSIKNDFIVWGKRTVNDVEVDIHYRLAIDEKPNPEASDSLCNQDLYEIDDLDGNLVRYDSEKEENTSKYQSILLAPAQQIYEDEDTGELKTEVFDWREELYRNALYNSASDDVGNYSAYDAEMIAFWRDIYDPGNENWITKNGDEKNHWNPSVFDNPQNLKFWLDFIDIDSEMGKYSVNRIGRRTLVKNEDKVSDLINQEVPDVIFLNNDEWNEPWADSMYIDSGTTYLTYQYYEMVGQQIFRLTDEWDSLFSSSSTGSSCYEKIRDLLYQYLYYNTTITITCLPKYYYEPNKLLYIEDRLSGITGTYAIKSFSLPLTYNGTMSIQLTENLVRI